MESKVYPVDSVSVSIRSVDVAMGLLRCAGRFGTKRFEELMTISFEYKGVTFEFPNRRAVRKFAESRINVASVIEQAGKRGPGVYEAVLRTPVHETVKPLHEMTDSEFSEHASHVFAEVLTGTRAGKPKKETEKRKTKENKKPRVKESTADGGAPAAAPQIDANGLFNAMGAAHSAQWGRGVGGHFSLSDFAVGYTGNDAPVIRVPGITPDSGV